MSFFYTHHKWTSPEFWDVPDIFTFLAFSIGSCTFYKVLDSAFFLCFYFFMVTLVILQLKILSRMHISYVFLRSLSLVRGELPVAPLNGAWMNHYSVSCCRKLEEFGSGSGSHPNPQCQLLFASSLRFFSRTRDVSTRFRPVCLCCHNFFCLNIVLILFLFSVVPIVFLIHSEGNLVFRLKVAKNCSMMVQASVWMRSGEIRKCW